MSADDQHLPIGAPVAPAKKARGSLTMVQSCRGIASVAVVAFHVTTLMELPRYFGDPVLWNFTKYGHLGVDFFFVLSGFIILMVHYRDIGRPEGVGRYAYRRFVRIYPVYWLYTCVLVALVLAGLGRNTNIPTTLAGWISSITLVRISDEAPPLGQAWTMFHELAFYTVFAIIIVNRRLGFTVLAVWLAVVIALFHYPPLEAQSPLSVYTSAYPLHFALGMLAYVAFRRLHWQACAAIGAIGLTLALVWQAHDSHAPVTKLVWACGFACLIMALASLETQFGVKAPRWLSYLGDASYSTYLLHIAVAGLLLKIAVKMNLDQHIGLVPTFFIVLVTSTVLGALAYRLIEHPILQALRDGPRRRSSPA